MAHQQDVEDRGGRHVTRPGNAITLAGRHPGVAAWEIQSQRSPDPTMGRR